MTYNVFGGTLNPAHSNLHSILPSDVSSRTWPRPRGASRTKISGLGLDNKVLGLGLGLSPKSLALILALTQNF